MNKFFLITALLVCSLACSWAEANEKRTLSETDDAEMNSIPADSRRVIHPSVKFDFRNADYTRGAYDEDGVPLNRVPFHALFAVAWDISHVPSGRADMWLQAESSNGFHPPSSEETTEPSTFYESNTLLGLVYRPVEDIQTALSYVLKYSPNGVSETSHEWSLAASYENDDGIGVLKPAVILSKKTEVGGALYAQLGIAPEMELGVGDESPSIGLFSHVGVGVLDFYGDGTGAASFVDLGVKYSHPLSSAIVVDGQVSGLYRDTTLRTVGGSELDTAAVIPLAQISLTAAF